MRFGRKSPSIIVLLCCLATSFLWTLRAFASESPASAAVRYHDLSVVLRPDSHELIATDRVSVVAEQSQAPLRFTLARSLHLEDVQAIAGAGTEQHLVPVSVAVEDVAGDSASRVVTVTLPSSLQAGEVTLQWRYAGPINDPPREPRHLRFVTPSETSGHIGPEGVYLSSESGWYPDLDGSLASFALSVEVPQGWTTVSQGVGRMQEDCSNARSGERCVVRQQWATGPSEALTLVANTFVAKTRAWAGKNGQAVLLATYFLPENAGLADEYLDATAKYLDAYVPLLGDYPFEKFAVVENFFASGLGMPSFTLLGSGSIKRHYVQSYALGHEIVHSWIGNAVFNRIESGNWVEGLTTYLANYYWHELVGDQRQAREQRRLMMQGYSLHVTPEQDYPVGRFHRKSDEKDNAIGYQKAAMVFHMLRREIGEDAFWRGLKQFVKQFRGRHADWTDVERVFAAQSGIDLRWFFAQWVERAGAPVIAIAEARALPADGAGSTGPFRLHIVLQQVGDPFRLSVPLEVKTKERSEIVTVPIGQGRNEVEITVVSEPISVELDPALTVFRRFGRDQLAPVLNLFVTDRHRAVLPAFGEGAVPLRELVARISAQESRLPEDQRARILPADTHVLPPAGSVLIVATPEHRAHLQSLLEPSCGGQVTLGEAGFEIDGSTYEGPGLAVLLSCHRAGMPGSVLTVLYAVTAEASAKVSRLLFFYGWQSYIVFHEGAVAKRELWQVPQSIKEVRLDGQRR